MFFLVAYQKWNILLHFIPVLLHFVKFKTKETEQKQITDMRRRGAAACIAILTGLAGLLQYTLLQMAIVSVFVCRPV